MATTKIWDVKSNFGRVIMYAENPDKTVNPQYAQRDIQELRDVMDYACDDFKTEKQFYVSGLNCDPANARRQMIRTKQRYDKTDGITAFHGYQSFAPDEVTAQQAHEIGIELARRLWGERFEVVVATHLNTRCYHNHFVLNSVSFADGKRYYDNKATYRLMRQTSDEICREHRISVIENPQGKAASYNAWQAEQQGKPTKDSLIRADIDEAVAKSLTFVDFVRNLEQLGYEVGHGNRKYLAVKPPFAERFRRLKTLGEGYSEDDIKQRILENKLPVKLIPISKPTPRAARLRGQFKNTRKVTGYRALYLHYCYKMGILPKTAGRSQKRAPFLLRQDLIHLDDITAQVQLLCEHKIDTREQLDAYRESVIRQISALDAQGKNNRSSQRRCKDETELERLKAEKAEMKKKRLALKKEVRLCDAIVERSERMTENLRAVNQQNKPIGKEMKENEHERSG